ncbi:MAG TPA: ABC transporter ATP-binding protein [Acetobacteraceae bacterium]|nr:ABC transporter ATP-binding protein [Acetobacteraceae bacterium]
MTAAALALDGLSKQFGAHAAVDAVSLEVQPGELIVLLGPSGCGKTTTLRMIAGFVPPSAGDIRLDGASIVALSPHRREMGIVFQSYALFPHLSVARNIAFGLEMRRMAPAAAQARVTEMLRLTKLEAFAARLPRQLSGGQQQRVALARALAIQPRVLLLDEPLSNLDADLRQEMAREIRILQRRGGITTIMVTHDQTEAMALADRLVVMHDGRVQQIGTPEHVHTRPATPFVARFIGGSNIVAGRLDRDRLVLRDGAEIALAGRYAGSGVATLAVRPDSVRLLAPGTASCIGGEVELCTWLGAVVEHAVRISPDLTLLARGPGLGSDATPRHTAGTRVALRWEADDERLFDAAGQAMEADIRETSHA